MKTIRGARARTAPSEGTRTLDQQIDTLGRLRLKIEALQAEAAAREAALLKALRRRADGWVPGRRFEARRILREVLEPDPRKVARLLDFLHFIEVVKVKVPDAEAYLGREKLRKVSTVSTIEALQVRARTQSKTASPHRR